MRTNQEFAKALQAPRSRFYLCDFHVHSPGSADTRVGERFAALSPDERAWSPELKAVPADLAAYEKTIISRCPVAQFYDQLLAHRDRLARSQGVGEERDWAIVAITDHNVAEYSAQLSDYAWSKRKQDRLLILPGIELEVKFPVGSPESAECTIHLLCIFAPTTSASDIRIAITDAGATSSWSFGASLRVRSLERFVHALRRHDSYPAMCIAAHVGSSKGMHSEVRLALLNDLDAAIARTQGELSSGENPDSVLLNNRLAALKQRQGDAQTIHDDVLREIGICGFDALQVRTKQDEKHYCRLHRFKQDDGRAVTITCSDAHAVAHAFTSDISHSFIKLPRICSSMSAQEVFLEIRDKGLRYADTRFAYEAPGGVTTWISGLEIVPDASTAESFWPFAEHASLSGGRSFTLPLSRNLNCLIGGRGSGKSAALEAIAFAGKSGDFDRFSDMKGVDLPEWYKRASATLCGCVVRLCWRLTATSGPTQRETRTVFQRRYFDANHRHGTVEVSDEQGSQLMGPSIPPLRLSLFRIHEIESVAEPGNLRDVFDRIKGDAVARLNTEIQSILTQLTTQRAAMLTTAQSIARLTGENTPLREYVRRKHQLVHVDKPEIKAKYQQVDDASAADAIGRSMREEWAKLTASVHLSDTGTRFTAFVSEFLRKLATNEQQSRPYCEHLLALIDGKSTPNRPEQIIAALTAAHDHMLAFGEQINVGAGTISSLHQAVRDQLSKEGLPTGAKERETKKRAFDEAVTSLEAYKVAHTSWCELLEARERLHGELEQKCIERTNLRKETAEEITRQLAQDLDASVLVIEADARPVADKEALTAWLTKHFAPGGGLKYRAARVRAIVQKGIAPAQLRDLFMSKGEGLKVLLVNEVEKAEDGRITSQDLEKWVDDTMCCYFSDPESKQEDLPPEIWQSLPDEVKRGFLQFDLSATSDSLSRLEAVLELDEVVFDDLPEIRLNDRPGDSGSRARPLGELSPGQRCSAILPILLLTGSGPLLIDQPEDNLDNRLIRQAVVNILASIKLRRQVIVATHNPNLPVLGDAEQSVILRAVSERGCRLDASGSLDSPDVVTFITDIMEGGREAFQYRQSIYQSHWDGPVAR